MTSKHVRLIAAAPVQDASGTKDMSWLESAFLRKEEGGWRIQFRHSSRVP